MRNFGLLDLWSKWYQPNPQQFLDTADKMMRQKPSSEKGPPRLSLKNLTGAFVVLLIGCRLVSFIVFLAENILSLCFRKP